MQPQVGDQLVIRGRRVGDATRTAMIVAVHGVDGPLRFSSPDGTETLTFPGPDTEIRPVDQR